MAAAPCFERGASARPPRARGRADLGRKVLLLGGGDASLDDEEADRHATLSAATKSPAELASEHEHDPHAPAARLILRAAAPWSPGSHTLWGAEQRARAVLLCKLGYLLAAAKVGRELTSS